MSIIFWMIVLVLIIYIVMTYNSLVVLKNNVSKAWANIDVLLKQRNDELPKLIDTCKAYMQHEAQVLESVVKARIGVDAALANHDATELSQAEAAMVTSLGGLYAVAENYPDLKANQTFINLQQRITGLENQIADRREFYNDTANINNVRIEQFPDLFVASIFRFAKAKLLRFAKDELSDVDVGARFDA